MQRDRVGSNLHQAYTIDGTRWVDKSRPLYALKQTHCILLLQVKHYYTSFNSKVKFE
jgi:hypothetical protein